MFSLSSFYLRSNPNGTCNRHSPLNGLAIIETLFIYNNGLENKNKKSWPTIPTKHIHLNLSQRVPISEPVVHWVSREEVKQIKILNIFYILYSGETDLLYY